ncbi:MAG TPA: tripartite tricarboxylate transporter substrate binding protein [Burkholderiales bacterium]|nr:tripartite tricarboxylate transporter substrate binding protein [Burkholderiales bacterium]
MNSGIEALAALALLAASAAAPSYPERPVRLIVAVPAGGTPDVVARMVAPGMSALLGQQLVVDNRPGAGGLIGTELAARAAPDGYTLLVSSPGPLAILPHVQRKVPYDALNDFAPVGLIASNPFLLIVHPAVPAGTVKELLAAARAEPGRFNYASAGNGSANHLAMELFKSMAGVSITHVPYKGAPQAVSDVLAGHMNMMFNSVPPVLAHIKAGRVRALGVAGARRSPQLPEVPTIAEAGVPGYEAITWFGLLAPAQAPKRAIARLSAALSSTLRAPETRSQLENQGMEPAGGAPEEFAALIRRDFEKYAKAVKLSGARVD